MFFLEDVAKKIVLGQILNGVSKYDVELIAYAVLSNHYHLLFYCDKAENVSKFIHQINGGTSFQLNTLTGIHQSLWGEKFNKTILDESAFDNILSYIIYNPYKHELVKNIEALKKYKFCNYSDIINTRRNITEPQNINIELE